MSRRDGACWRHPTQRAAGVCADCLKERLSALSPSASDSLLPHPSSSYGDRSSAFGFVVVDRKKLASSSNNNICSNNHRLGSGDYGLVRGQQQLVSPLLSEAYLRRSKSWSHWEGSVAGGNSSSHARNHQYNGFAGRKSDAVLDDWTRQRFFSIFAKDQSQQKRKEVCGGSASSNIRSTPLQQQGIGFQKSASENERGERLWVQQQNSKVDCRGQQSFNTEGTILENGNLDEGLNTASNSSAGKNQKKQKSSSRKSFSSPAWWSSLLQLAFRKPKSKGEPSENRNCSTSTGQFTRSIKQEGKKQPQQQQWRKTKTATTNNACKAPIENNKWMASPLRIFKGGNSQKQQRKQDSEDQDLEQQQQKRVSCCEERSSWSIPSSTELKKLHSTTPAYTAYYRDYGAWSLSSSPVPNNRWSNGNNNRGKQPWENRDVASAAAVAAAASAAAQSSSSPYHHHHHHHAAAGNSTWNFYLTPLRPVKATSSSASKHHRY